MGAHDYLISSDALSGPAVRRVLRHRSTPDASSQSSVLYLCRSGQVQDNFDWGTSHVLRWKLPEKMGGGKDFLFRFKDAWVRYYKDEITRLSEQRGFPAWLLAGIAWNEVGGDPGWIDDVAFQVRQFDHVADPFLEPLTITKKEELTSMGDVSIQLRRAAEAMGLSWQSLNRSQRSELVTCLQDEPSNLALVAMHVRQLIDVDYPGQTALSDEQVLVVGARYNRGPMASLASIKQNSSYGRAILKRKDRLMDLLLP